MNTNKDLYHDEVDSLRKFRTKIEVHAIYKEDLDAFSNEYEELIAQTKVITRISDRLQNKLDNANLQIQGQNKEIKEKNIQLANTIDQLVTTELSRKASTVMLTVAAILFILEQIFIEPIIEENIDLPYIGYGILAILFLLIKFCESGLEKYFISREKQKNLKIKQR